MVENFGDALFLPDFRRTKNAPSSRAGVGVRVYSRVVRVYSRVLGVLNSVWYVTKCVHLHLL